MSQNSLLKPRRGRPSAERAEAIDRHIIAVARQMFLAEGYDVVAMEQVAFAANISKGTLYARHSSKEALFSAVVDAAIRDWSDEASTRDHLLTDDIGQRLKHHAGSIVASLHRPDVLAFQRLVLSVRDRFPGAAQAMYAQGYRYIVEYIADDIRAAAERDGMEVRDAAVVAEILVAAITGRQIQEGYADEGLGAYAERAVDLLMAARANW